MPPTLTPRSDGRSRQPKASRSPQCCTVIEFAGIPGSGKSTLAAALTRELAPVVPVSMPDRFEYRRKALSTKEKFRLDLRYAARSAGYRLRRLRYDIGRARPGFWVMRNSWLKSRYPLVLFDKLQHEPAHFCILDEWLLHRTIDESIREYDASLRFSREFAFACSNCRFVYVFVHVQTEVARSRILQQERDFRWFAQPQHVNRIDEILELWRIQLNALRTEIDRLRLSCIDVDGESAVQANAVRLAVRLLDAGESSGGRQAILPGEAGA